MEVNYLKILLIDLTLYHWHVWKVVHNMVVKKKKHEYIRYRWLKGLFMCIMSLTDSLFAGDSASLSATGSDFTRGRVEVEADFFFLLGRVW